MSRAFKLFRLQQVDSQLDQRNTRLAEIHMILEEGLAVREANQVKQLAETTQREAQKHVREAEENVKTQQTQLSQNQSSLYGGKVTNPKELQDLQKEAEALGKRLRDLEDHQLEKMTSLEEAQSILAKAEESLDAVKAQQAVEERALHSEQSKLLEDIAQLNSERASVLAGVSAADLSTYDSVRKSKAGLAVSKVQNHECSICGAELSAALSEAARSPEELVRCDNCKRILYGG